MKCSVLAKVTITLECSVLLMVTITLKSSVFLTVTHSEVFSAPYGHSDVFSSPYGHCHSAVFSSLYGHCHSAPYRHSAVVMNVPSPRTASRPNDAAASHSCHFNTVLYPRSYSECQLPLNRSRRCIPSAASSVQNNRKFSQSQHYFHWHLCRPVNIYIMLYNVPL
jgi:hypothetical protein